MGIVMEAVDQLLDVLVEERVMGDRVHPVATLSGIGQVAVYQEVGDLEEAAAFGQLLDRIAAVAEDAALAIDEGDRAPTTRRVEEGGIIAEQARAGPIGGDLLEVGGGDRTVADRDLVATTGSVVRDGQRVFCHGSRTLSASASALAAYVAALHQDGSHREAADGDRGHDPQARPIDAVCQWGHVEVEDGELGGRVRPS